MTITTGLHEVSRTALPGILDEAARQGVPVFTLSTGGRTDKEAFFRAVREALPLDPPLGPGRVWDALADSVWNGLQELGAPLVVVVWPDAGPVAGAEGDHGIALDILRELVASLADDRFTVGRPNGVAVYVAEAAPGGAAGPTEA
ncbi:barstar family protein [Streptomyces sp. SBR177]